MQLILTYDSLVSLGKEALRFQMLSPPNERTPHHDSREQWWRAILPLGWTTCISLFPDWRSWSAVGRCVVGAIRGSLPIGLRSCREIRTRVTVQ